MNLGIMQPYFLPYIGYFQLIKAVDCFVVYDNIQYTKKGWINRNRFLQNNQDVYFSLPLQKGSDYLNVVERNISANYNADQLIAKLRGAYRKAPFFKETIAFLSPLLQHTNRNLFLYVYHSIRSVCDYLEINTPLIVSSTIDVDHSLKAQEKVISLCSALKATIYTNPIGGKDLYNSEAFLKQGIRLDFFEPHIAHYTQFSDNFIGALSIIDVLMFNGKEKTRDMIHSF